MTSVAPSQPLPLTGDEPEAGSNLQLTLDAGPAAVEVARRAVLDFLAPRALSPTAIYAVELVLEEVLMNIAWHAYDEHAKHEARLSIQVDADEVQMCFEDDGRAFDPTLAAEARPPGSLAEARPGGLGLKLVRGLVRRMSYQRGDGCNQLMVRIARR